jgi:hypothetical protein
MTVENLTNHYSSIDCETEMAIEIKNYEIAVLEEEYDKKYRR